MRRIRRKRKKRERRRGKRLDYYYYFAVSYKYSFLLLDESGRLALQAVSRVKSANERLLQAPRREPPLGFPFFPSFSPLLSHSRVSRFFPTKQFREATARRAELREFV